MGNPRKKKNFNSQNTPKINITPPIYDYENINTEKYQKVSTWNYDNLILKENSENNIKYISSLNINSFTRHYRYPNDYKKIKVIDILREENNMGLFLIQTNIQTFDHRIKLPNTSYIASKKSLMKRKQGGISFYFPKKYSKMFSKYQTNEIVHTRRKIFVK